MNNLVFAGIVPHPPIVIPEVGKGEVAKVAQTITALKEWSRLCKDAGPEVLILISPHNLVFRDAIAVNAEEYLEGDLAQFGAGQVKIKTETPLDYVEGIIEEATKLNIPTLAMDEDMAHQYGLKTELDHGALVPLYYLRQAGVNIPVVLLAMGMLPFEELFSFGVAIQKAVHKLGKKVAVVASGDLSHCLSLDAPGGYTPQGKEFDSLLVSAVKELDVIGIRDLDPVLVEKAGECGLRPIIMLLGAMDGLKVKSNIHSYEGPFGVGYLVASFVPKGESPLVNLARQSLEHYIKNGHELTEPDQLAPEMKPKAGVFVSIKKHGQLRGCIGTIGPTKDNVAQEIMNNAISAGINDPRFSPVTDDELDDLVYSVDVLKAPEPITHLDQLDVQRYGVIVSAGRRSGLLLPNLEGVETVEEQVAIARQKAGIGPKEPVNLERFEVIRYY